MCVLRECVGASERPLQGWGAGARECECAACVGASEQPLQGWGADACMGARGIESAQTALRAHTGEAEEVCACIRAQSTRCGMQEVCTSGQPVRTRKVGIDTDKWREEHCMRLCMCVHANARACAAAPTHRVGSHARSSAPGKGACMWPAVRVCLCVCVCVCMCARRGSGLVTTCSLGTPCSPEAHAWRSNCST